MGTTAFQRYVETPIQTLDGIIVTQPKHFLPLAQEARKITEEIHIEKINKQWAGLPQEQLLNQSFNDQLNSIQILEQLAPLQLTKDHLPGDIIDILKRLGKADNIYHKISELQQQLPHPTQHMNTGDIIQINAPEFDPDIDGRPSTKEHGEIQGSDNPIQHRVEETKKSEAPALPQQVKEEVDQPRIMTITYQ